MDLATAAGLGLALVAVVVSALMEGSALASLLKPSAAVLVLGGTLGATMVCYSLKDFLALPRLILRALRPPQLDPAGAAKLLVGLSETARREGLLSLEKQMGTFDDPFLKKGLRLAIDGNPPELVQSMLETEVALLSAKLKSEASIFETAGGFAPTMGIIGTVMGLVHVLGNLAEPEKLGEAIATAFIATFYGISTANLFWLPLGNKLKNLARQEVLLKQLTLEGVLSIQRGDNPYVVAEKLRAFLVEPPAEPQGDAA